MKARLLHMLPDNLRAIPPLSGTVIAREDLAPAIVRIRARGPEFRSLGPWRAGQHLDVLVHRRWPIGGRHYTPTYVDRERGEIELIAHVHGDACDEQRRAKPTPGSDFFRTVGRGDGLTVWGPGGGFTLRQQQHQPVFIGDETTLATWVALCHEAAVRELPTPIGFVSVASYEQRHVVGALQLPLAALVRGDCGGRDELAVDALRALDPPDDAIFYLAGRVGTIQRLRTFLRQDGLALDRIRPKGFWTEDRRAL